MRSFYLHLSAFLSVCFGLTGSGHTLPISFLTLVPDAEYLHLEWTFNPFELSFARELDANGNGRIDPQEWEVQGSNVTARVLGCLRVKVGDQMLQADVSGITPDLDSHHATLRAHYRVDARSYTQWKRLTGPDFTNRSANYDYLKTSVPQFLTQFLRPQYLPDALMIYGAYVDSAALPDTGEAELIEQWNREFEYPKLVCASDAEYFQYIAKRCGDKLPVYRGDCGAYWEDGVGFTALATSQKARDNIR